MAMQSCNYSDEMNNRIVDGLADFVLHFISTTYDLHNLELINLSNVGIYCVFFM